MITLTNAIKVPNSIGGTTTTNYDKLVIRSISVDPKTFVIDAAVEISSAADPTQPIIQGTLHILALGNSPFATLQVPSVNFLRTIPLAAGDLTAMQPWVTTLQQSIESGLVSKALVAGTASAGT